MSNESTITVNYIGGKVEEDFHLKNDDLSKFIILLTTHKISFIYDGWDNPNIKITGKLLQSMKSFIQPYYFNHTDI